MDKPEHVGGTMQKMVETMIRNLLEFAEGIRKLSLKLYELSEEKVSWLTDLTELSGWTSSTGGVCRND